MHIAKLMPLPLTVSCFSKIQIGFTFLVPAHLGSPEKGPLDVCVLLYVQHQSSIFFQLLTKAQKQLTMLTISALLKLRRKVIIIIIIMIFLTLGRYIPEGV